MCRERGQPCKSWPEFTLLAIINRGSRISFVSLLFKDFLSVSFFSKVIFEECRRFQINEREKRFALCLSS